MQLRCLGKTEVILEICRFCSEVFSQHFHVKTSPLCFHICRSLETLLQLWTKTCFFWLTGRTGHNGTWPTAWASYWTESNSSKAVSQQGWPSRTRWNQICVWADGHQNVTPYPRGFVPSSSCLESKICW